MILRLECSQFELHFLYRQHAGLQMPEEVSVKRVKHEQSRETFSVRKIRFQLKVAVESPKETLIRCDGEG